MPSPPVRANFGPNAWPRKSKLSALASFAEVFASLRLSPSLAMTALVQAGASLPKVTPSTPGGPSL